MFLDEAHFGMSTEKAQQIVKISDFELEELIIKYKKFVDLM